MTMHNVLGLILGGGVGSRLFPLTLERAKPAVPFAGKYRLIDIPMSNCLNSGINKIAILTQFNSVSLHRHIYGTYRRDVFSQGWVQILAAEQTHASHDWYQGTADAVRKQLLEIREAGTEYVLVLAGDHLYRMDYEPFVERHISSKADITIAVQPVTEEEVAGFGILKLNDEDHVVKFVEKPKTPEAREDLASGDDPTKPYMASMGIYVFSTAGLIDIMGRFEGDDFGSDIIPGALNDETLHVVGYPFDGYWADIGTMRRFFEVNLEMAAPLPRFDLYDRLAPIYTRPRFLPGSKVQGGHLQDVLLADGCRVTDSTVRGAVIGLRSIVGAGVTISRAIIMGSDYYEQEADWAVNLREGRPNIGIGEGSVIEQAIIDKNARIGRHVIIRGNSTREDETHESWSCREGIIIVPKNGVIQDGTII